jgi:hypothetical protein
VIAASIIKAMSRPRGTLLITLMEAGSTSETSANSYQTTRSNNPEDNHHLKRVKVLSTTCNCNLRKSMAIFNTTYKQYTMFRPNTVFTLPLEGFKKH